MGIALLVLLCTACVTSDGPRPYSVPPAGSHGSSGEHGWQDPDDRAWFHEGLAQARFTPDALSHNFINRLDRLPPQAPEHGLFYDSLHYIHWYDAPAARAYVANNWPGFYDGWLERHALTLYVHVRDNRILAQDLTGSLLDSLPAHIRLVRSPRKADAVLEVTSEPVTFRETVKNSKLREKKYPKRLWKNQLIRCDRMEIARFTEETRLISAHYDIRLQLLMRGRIVASDRIRATSNMTYKVGSNLQAVTPCGVKDTTVFPNNGVRSLFEEHDRRTRAQNNLHVAIAHRTANAIADMPISPDMMSRRY